MVEEIEKQQKSNGKLLGGITGKGFMPGVSGNPKGLTPETPEQKLIKKAVKELIKDYQQTLAEALPKISPVLIKKAIEGDIMAIKELHDRAMGKPPQKTDITSAGKQIPILGGITQVKEEKEDE